MKKFSLLLIAVLIGQFIYAQNNDSPTTNYKNDIGFDATHFLTFLNSNLSSNSSYFLTYRRNWFGASFADCLQHGLREMTEWTMPETELMAAFVSKLNQCEY